jgi:hypothetical protein
MTIKETETPARKANIAISHFLIVLTSLQIPQDMNHLSLCVCVCVCVYPSSTSTASLFLSWALGKYGPCRRISLRDCSFKLQNTSPFLLLGSKKQFVVDFKPREIWKSSGLAALLVAYFNSIFKKCEVVVSHTHGQRRM